MVGLFGELLVDARLEKLEVNRTSTDLGSINMLSVWELTEGGKEEKEFRKVLRGKCSSSYYSTICQAQFKGLYIQSQLNTYHHM